MHVIVVFAVLACLATAEPVISLPGLNSPLPSQMDSGYITVDEAHGRALYYFFVESQRAPTTDPLVIWFTGGPGCSSLIALLSEHGPFTTNFSANGAGIQLNPYTWSTVANVIYVESPAGVGFSYSNTSTDYVTGDLQTATDAYTFLQGFLGKFPQFRSNPFWVTGESYGGHYVPEFAYFVEMKNKEVSSADHINLVGLMAGNPWTAPDVEAFGVTDNWWYRGMISQAVHDDIDAFCTYKDITFWIINNVSAAAATLSAKQRVSDKLSSALTPNETRCYNALIEGSKVQFGGVNILGVYLDVCNTGTRGDIPDQPNYCSDNQLTAYLNRADVQQAIHIRNPPVAWAECSSTVSYNTNDTQSSVLYAYKYFIENTTMRILIYSGDNDAIVPTTGTRRWIRVLNRPIVNDVHQWWVDTNGPQVGGWATKYDRLTFTTVRDAGHMVPYMQPKRALFMFQTFLDGLDL
jgi:serine carboxypeptidase-like clade II